jgi:hypothetical protein
MDELDDLLEAAKRASRLDRISWRDPIAAHGQRAIPRMRGWLDDPEFAAFAVRVLEKIGEQAADQPAVIAALESVGPSETSPAVDRDIASALDRLGRGRVRTGAPTRTAPQWSGYSAASALEKRFHHAMVDIFTLAGEATRKERPDGTFIRGYWASYFLRGVRNHGGVAYAHQLLQATGTTAGFERLKEENRLDLTMEALVLRPEFDLLFSAHERQIAASRLARAGYQPPTSKIRQ